MADRDDYEMYLLLSGASGCSLNTSPGKNWVEKAGGLPGYICRIARAVMTAGHSKSSAIAIAVGRAKTWAAGGSKVTPKTRAKAAAAVAQWEALKAKNKAGNIVKATSPVTGQEFLMLSNAGSFNTEIVRQAWEQREKGLRDALRAQVETVSKYVDDDNEETSPVADYDSGAPWNYIRELWTDFLIVQFDNGEAHKVPYTVDGLDVTFGDPVDVQETWVEVDDGDDDELSEEEHGLLADILGGSSDDDDED